MATCCAGVGAQAATASVTPSGYVQNGTFIMDINSDPGTINPMQSTEGSARQIFAFGYDTLLGRSAQGKPLPDLAYKWTETPSKVTYTLRPNVKCDDGSTLTASDVAADFNYIKNPKTLSPWLSFTLPVKYTASADNATGTVTLTTAQPFGLLAQGAGELPIMCPAGLKSPDSYAHLFDGTGPYQITNYSPGTSYTMTVRPGYDWGPNGASTSAPGTPKQVDIRFVASETTEANQLLAGEVNVAQISGSDAARLGSFKYASTTTLGGELWFNEAPGRQFADPKLRLAVAEAMNIPQVADVGTGGRGKVAPTLEAETPSLCPGETTSALPGTNVAAAKALLQSDGWVPGSGGIRYKDGKPLTVTLMYQVGSEQTVSAVELIAQEWKAIGVNAVLPGYEEGPWTQILTVTSDYDVAYSSINLEFPFQYSDFFGGPSPQNGGDNFGDIHNPQFEKLSAQALGTLGTAGCALWVQAQKALMHRADVIPISVIDNPYYLYRVTAQASGILLVPTSIRLLS